MNVAMLGSTSPNTTGIGEEFATATSDIRGMTPLFRVLAVVAGRRLTATLIDFGRNTSCWNASSYGDATARRKVTTPTAHSSEAEREERCMLRAKSRSGTSHERIATMPTISAGSPTATQRFFWGESGIDPKTGGE